MPTPEGIIDESAENYEDTAGLPDADETQELPKLQQKEAPPKPVHGGMAVPKLCVPVYESAFHKGTALHPCVEQLRMARADLIKLQTPGVEETHVEAELTYQLQSLMIELDKLVTGQTISLDYISEKANAVTEMQMAKVNGLKRENRLASC